MVGGPSKIGQQGGGWGINQGCGGQNMVITGPCYPLVRLNIRGAAYIRAFKGPGSPRVPKSRSFSRWGKRPPCYRVRHLFASLEFRSFHHLPWLFKERRFKRRQILVNGSPGIILGAWQVIWTFIVMFFNFEKQKCAKILPRTNKVKFAQWMNDVMKLFFFQLMSSNWLLGQ